jgi:hypothetical protein
LKGALVVSDRPLGQLLETMAHQVQTPGGNDLCALRKQIPEPVFGIIKSVMGFRQFSLRGLEKVRGKWKFASSLFNVGSHDRLLLG